MSGPDDALTGVEHLLARDLDDSVGIGKPLSDRAAQTQRSLELYLKAGVRPRWMERVIEIDRGIARARAELADAYRALREEHGDDHDGFARRWRALAHSWRFGELNTLIEQHNDWYPIERDLPLNPRTGEYVRIAGRSYRRPELTPQWVLDQFPAEASR